MSTNITGYTTVCDWEHDGDYDYYENILDSIDGVRTTDRESHGDGNTAYIYFECHEESIIPLLQNQELESIHIDYNYSKLLPDDFAKGLKKLKSEEQFLPARLIDKIDTPLSWRYHISYKTYLRKFKDQSTFLEKMSELNLCPSHICNTESEFILFGTTTLDSQIKTIYAYYVGNLSYYFTNKSYSSHEFRYGNKFEDAIRKNFKEIVYSSANGEKIKLSTRTEEDNKRIYEELAQLEDYLSSFFAHRKDLAEYYQIDYTGTTKQTLVMKQVDPEGFKFFQLVCPFTVSKIKANKKKIELTDTDGNIHHYRSGSRKICTEKFYHNGEEPSPMIEHDIFISMIYGIDIEYFY